nr:MAG TPA: hypothetical protein [Caudoviricetes sp.]
MIAFSLLSLICSAVIVLYSFVMCCPGKFGAFPGRLCRLM